MISDKQKNLYFAFWTFILIFISYGSQFFKTDLRVDTEYLINSPKTFHVWPGIGRFGAIITKHLFNCSIFNPFFETSVSFLFIGIIFFMWRYVCENIFNISSSIAFILMSLFFVSPIFVEQFYFSMQILPVTFAIILLSSTLILSYFGVKKRNNLCLLISILFLIWAFGTYQIFVILYVSFAMLFVMFMYLNIKIDNENDKSRFIFKFVAYQIAIFSVAVICYFVLWKSFFNYAGNYLDGMKMVGSLKDRFLAVVSDIKTFLLSKNIYVNVTYILSSVMMLLIGLIEFQIKTKKLSFLLFISIVLFELIPFAMTFYLCTTPIIRSQLVLPFVYAGNISFIISYFYSNTKIRKLFIFVGFILLGMQITTVERLNYSDYIRTQEDLKLAYQLEERIRNCTDDREPTVAFIGAYHNNLNNICLRGDMIGNSCFSFNISSDTPHYFSFSSRNIGLLSSIGIKYQLLDKEKFTQARKIAYDMPSWPNKNCVKNIGDYVIVKFSGDDYYCDDIEQSINFKEELHPKFITTDENFKSAIDSVSETNNKFNIIGWCFEKNFPDRKFDVCLFDEKSKRFIILNTYKYFRSDVTNSFGLDRDYNYCGFKAKIGKRYLDQFKYSKIVLSYELNSQRYCFDTDIYFKDMINLK